MKKLLTLSGLLAVGAALLYAAVPTYVSKNASGSTSATVVFVATPNRQVVIKGAVATSDKAPSVLSFRTGGAAYVVTNAATDSAIVYQLRGASGLTTNDVVLLQTSSGSTASATVSYVTNSVYLVTAATFGVAVTTNDTIYELSSATTIRCGTNNPAAPTVYQGEALYVGAGGRPVRVVLDGTSACSVDSITARYE